MNLNYILRAKKFKTKKSLGQNFLIDSNVIEFIANEANNEDEILEIGSGIGFVTEQLVQKAKKVVAVVVIALILVTAFLISNTVPFPISPPLIM